MNICCDYPGGNIRVVQIGDSLVRLEQDIRDTSEWWFYWNFCATSDDGGEYRSEFCNGEVLGLFGPAISHDRVHWDWLGTESVEDRKTFVYRFAPGETAYFAFCFPYQLSNLQQFLQSVSSTKAIRQDVLTTTEAGRPLPLLTLGNREAGTDIVFTARHHACEAPGSYMLEGVLAYLLQHEHTLDNHCFHVVPFVDLDGVERGDQGKSRAPHDHNRDYLDAPHYAATAALMDYIRGLKLHVGIDFHAPYKWGGNNDHPFFVKQESPMREEIEALGARFREVTEHEGAIRYKGDHDVEMGSLDWVQPGMPNASGFYRKQDPRLCFTFEFPYFGLGDPAYTQARMRQFGMDFGRALVEYLVETS